MKASPCVSVIVPVYQGRELFNSLLQDLRNQTLQNIEIILIDDCGQDDSFSYAIQAAKEDSRIVCLHNECNVGQGICRNKGIEIASGEYLAFADADDIIPVDYYERLYIKAKIGNYKVVKGNRIAVYPDGRHQYSLLNESITAKLKKGHPLHCAFTWEHQTAIFLREHIMQCGARNAEGRRDQDTAFLLWALYDIKPEEFNFVPEAVYYYRKHDNAVTANINYTYMVELMKSFAFKLAFLKTMRCGRHTLAFIEMQAEIRFNGRLCAALQNDTETEESKWIALIGYMRAMLRDFVNHHPLKMTREFTTMALDASISDEQMLRHCQSFAANTCIAGFSPKAFDEISSTVEQTMCDVHIATTANNATVVSCIVALQSMKSSQLAASQYTIHVFTDALSQMWLEVLKQLQSANFNVLIHEEVDISLHMGKYPKWTLDEATILFLPSMLQYIDKILFCPANLLIKGDISCIYSHPMGDASLASSLCPDPNGVNQQYNGLQLLHLGNIRKNKYADQAREQGVRLQEVLSLEDKRALHPRYGITLNCLYEYCDSSSPIASFNKLISGCAYTNAYELLKDARVIIYPYNQEQCLNNADTFSQSWRHYLKQSPAEFILVGHKQQGDVSIKLNTMQEAAPAPQKTSSPILKTSNRKTWKILDLPIWSITTKKDKSIYRLFGVRIFKKKHICNNKHKST